MCATTKKPTKHTKNIIPLGQKDNILKDYSMPGNSES